MKRAMSLAGALATLVLVGATPVLAEEGPPEERPPGWVPYIELAADLHQDDLRGEISSTVPQFAAQTGNKNYHNTPLGFNGRLGLKTPQLSDRYGKPRMFLDAGVYVTPETKEFVIDIGDIANQFIFEGGRIIRKYQNPSGIVGLGAEFTLPWVDERFRLKPSIEYQVEKLEIEGQLRVDLGGVLGTRSFEQKVDDVYHSIGLGLEGEFVIVGGLSLYLESRVLWLLTDDKISFNNAPNNVTWTYIRDDDIQFSGAFGFRYSYYGF